MQKIFFLFFVVGLLGCQNAEKAKVDTDLARLINTYRQLPEQYQQELDFLDLLLKPVTQKSKFELALMMARGRQKFDSLYIDFLGKPFDAFKESAHRSFAEVETDSIQILICHSHSLTTIVETYYLGSEAYVFKKVKIDPSCNPLTGSKALNAACFELLEQKNKPSLPESYKDLIAYLQECDFYSFPTRVGGPCMDGDGVTVLVKHHQEYRVVSAHCPSKLHPLSIILNKAERMLQIN